MSSQPPAAEDQELYLTVKGVALSVSLLRSLSPIDRALLIENPHDPARREARKRRLERLEFVYIAIGGFLGALIASLPWWVVDPAHGTPAINDWSGPRVLVALAGFLLVIAGVVVGGHLAPIHGMRRVGFSLEEFIEKRQGEIKNRETAEWDMQERDAREERWLQAVRDALYWWAAHGAKLNSDPSYMEEYVAIHSRELSLRKEAVLQAFRSSDDPFATKEKTKEAASWVVATRAEVLDEHTSDKSLKDPDRLAEICWAYRRRETALLPEVEAYLHAQSARLLPKRPISVLQSFEEVIAAYDSLIEAKEVGTQLILDRASRMPASEREAYVKDTLRLLLRLIAVDMERRMKL